MSMLTASIVDTEALWQTAVAAIGGGLGIVLFFSVAIWGLTTASDLRAVGRSSAASAALVLGVFGLLASVALVGAGVAVMLA